MSRVNEPLCSWSEAFEIVPLAAAYMVKQWPESGEVKAVELILQGWEITRGDIENQLAKIESPIERMLFLPLYLKAGDTLGLHTQTQLQQGSYRADMALVDTRDDDKVLAIVECDGHDFHERTKYQAARDKSRDRQFTASGIPTFRFTGSEIARNASACADEVVAAMVSLGRIGKLRRPKVAE